MRLQPAPGEKFPAHQREVDPRDQQQCRQSEIETLAGRAVLILVAWLSYYTASRSLGLAELVSLYFAAPIFVVVLSVVMLKERVTPPRWAAGGAASFGSRRRGSP